MSNPTDDAQARALTFALDIVFKPRPEPWELQEAMADYEHERERAACSTEPCCECDPEGGPCCQLGTENCLKCGGFFCQDHRDNHSCEPEADDENPNYQH